MIRAKSALAGAGALVLAGALAAGVAHAADPAARPSTAHPAHTTWVGSWGSVPTTVPPASTTMFSNQTIRQTVHLSIGGSALQVRFSNEFGTAPLVIGEAHVGLAAGSQPSRSVAPGSDRRLSFAGHVSATVPPGRRCSATRSGWRCGPVPTWWSASTCHGRPGPRPRTRSPSRTTWSRPGT
jgi:hypothetical protein